MEENAVYLRHKIQQTLTDAPLSLQTGNKTDHVNILMTEVNWTQNSAMVPHSVALNLGEVIRWRSTTIEHHSSNGCHCRLQNTRAISADNILTWHDVTSLRPHTDPVFSDLAQPEEKHKSLTNWILRLNGSVMTNVTVASGWMQWEIPLWAPVKRWKYLS